MITCVNLDTSRRQFCFEEFPDTTLNYLDTASEEHELVNFQVRDKPTQKVISVFMKQSELKRIGISPSVWKKSACEPEKLFQLIESTAAIDRMLGKAAIIASNYLSEQFLAFFTDDRMFATRKINRAIHKKWNHLSGRVAAPGVYFQFEGSSTHIFINLKKNFPFKTGQYGNIKKVLFLSTSQQSPMLVAKKIYRDTTEPTRSQHFVRELLSLRDLSNKRGIISLIAGGIYADKCAIFFPIYECDLYTYLTTHPFSLTMEEKLSMISQWLEGLATLSEKGIHRDITSKNLFLKKDSKNQVEAVISGFNTFCLYGREKHGLTTAMFGSPEYFAKKLVTSKQDVWGMGISLHGFLTNQTLPCWKLHKEQEMAQWTATLNPDWILQHTTNSQIPKFLVTLINAMLDPRHDCRLSAKDAFKQFSEGLSSYKAAGSSAASNAL